MRPPNSQFYTDEDATTLSAIERWRETAASEIDGIGGWREGAEEQFQHAGDPSREWGEMPQRFYGDTTYLVARIHAQYPRLNFEPLEAIYGAVAIWHERRTAAGLPDQSGLWHQLRMAVMTLQAVEVEIRSRAARAALTRYTHDDGNGARMIDPSLEARCRLFEHFYELWGIMRGARYREAGDLVAAAFRPSPPNPFSQLKMDSRETCPLLEKALAVIEDAVVGARGTPASETRDTRTSWTVDYTNQRVSEYLSRRREQYRELTHGCIAGDRKVLSRFQKLFGPTAIARELGDGCYRSAVAKTRAYQQSIRCVLNSRPPPGYEPSPHDLTPLSDTIAGMREKARPDG